MSSYAVIDETFDLNISSTYHLSIQTGLGGFSFCILDTLRNKYIALKHIQYDPPLRKELLINKIKTTIHSERYLKKKFKKVFISFVTPDSILIPNSMFDKDTLTDYFRFCRDLSDRDEIYFNKLKNTETYNVFALPADTESVLSDLFPVCNIFHHATAFIENALISNRSKFQKKIVYINIHRTFFDILVTGGNSLLLYNTFRYGSPNDLIYYILYIYKQLELSTEINGLIISGEISSKSSNTALIKKYIKHVRLERFNDKFFYSYTFNKIPKQYFSNLINLYACGS